VSADVVIRKVEATARTWRAEAEKRRGISKSDPVADTLEYCAGELTTGLKMVAAETQFLSVEQFARKERVTPQTVRAWIRENRLAAEPGVKGYRIAKDATVTPRVVRRKAG
jgi:hypothetical protein